MNILIYDEDTASGIISEFRERLQSLNENAIQVADWRLIEEKIKTFKPNAFIIDLMIPPVDLPTDDCGAGYTTGAYVYKTHIHPHSAGTPFVIFTAADIGTSRISQAIQSLKGYREFRGIFEKGEDAEVVLKALTEK